MSWASSASMVSRRFLEVSSSSAPLSLKSARISFRKRCWTLESCLAWGDWLKVWMTDHRLVLRNILVKNSDI